MSATMDTRNGHSDLVVTAQNGYDMAHTLLDYMRSIEGVKVEHFEVKAALIVLDVIFILVGIALFRRAERYIRSRGALSQF